MSERRWKRASARRRRALYTQAGLVTATAGLAFWMTGAHAQDGAAPEKNAETKAAQGDAGQNRGRRGQQGGATLRIVPMPRKDANAPAGRQAAPMPPGAAPAAPDTPAPEETPGRRRGGRGGATFTFNYTGADIDNVLKFYAQVSNLTISKDPALTGSVTIINPKPVTLDEAFKILQSVLSVRGFTALQNGDVLNIVPLDRAVGSTTLISPEVDPKQIDPRNQVMTQVIPLDNVDAEALAKELTPLINKGASLIGSAGTNALILTDSASNVQRFIELVNALDKTSNRSEMRIYPLKHAEATAIADIINNLYKQITTRGRGAPQQGQPGQPGPPPGQPGQQQQSNGRPSVVAVPDQRTNSVLVVASPETQEQIARTIISRLDDDDSSALETKFRKIKYADATEIANQVNTVLSNMHGGGAAAQSSSGTPFQQRAFGGFGFGGFGFGGNQQQQQTVTSSDPFGKVVADARTNSVLITASAERMETIDRLIDQLDVDVPVETTTFVLPLKNAQADDVAYALSQAFNTGQNNNNPFGGFFFFGGGNNQSSNQRRQPIQRRLGQSNNNSGFGRSAPRRYAPPGPPNAPDGGGAGDSSAGAGNTGSAAPQGIPGVMTPQGFVPTEGGENGPDSQGPTRQFFRGFGQPRGIGQISGPQYGRGRTGNYANLLQLQNNVFVTPAPGGDSIIVTTTPDNYQAVKELVEALDVVPRQVMIEVIVAEVTLDSDKKLGLSLGGKFARLFGLNNTAQGTINLPTTATPVFDPLAPGAQFVVNAANYNALLQAIATDSKIKVLSTPRVFTSNNQQAEIDIITRQPYITGQTAGGLINTNVSNTVDFLDIGFILNVTPRITRQGLVTIDLQQEASDLVRFDTLGTGISALRVPVTNDRYADTSVTVQDGETVVIGGLIRDSKALNITKIPILSEIPLIGQFFRSRETIHSKIELMIFLTPHVISSVEEARALTLKQGGGIIKELPDLPKQQPNLDPNRFQTPPAPTQGQPQPGKAEPGKAEPGKAEPGTTAPEKPEGSPLLLPQSR
ncbi:MAG TPA: secretin N-terminal domain-containing protein [Chthonomonadaceae bacterium]|nr:secretin N-terminal domain-containing protein [Chthonomonadaceae bacterium]